MSEKIVVVGLGSPLRRDDGIGLVLLDMLRATAHSGAEYLSYGTMSLDLIQRLTDFDTAVLIDAVQSPGALPGELFIKEVSTLDYASQVSVTSSHELDLKTFFDLAKKLKINTRMFLAGVQVKDVSFGEDLSEPLRQRLPQLTEAIESFIVSL